MNAQSKAERKAEEAIAALLAHATIGEAAKAVGVSELTLRRWMKEPCFAKLYRQARGEILRAGTMRLRNLYGAAVANLGNIMVDPVAPFSVRVRASQAVAELALRANEAEDINERLTLLEGALEEGGTQA